MKPSSDNRKEEALFTLRNSWLRNTVGGLIAITVVSIAIAFLWLPSAQSNDAITSLWRSICGAAGVPFKWGASHTIAPPVRSSDVVLDANLIDSQDPRAVGRGATLAQRCTMCHGAQGISNADSPNLAGQYPMVVYKQLHDYQSGKRENVVMQAMVRDLSEAQIRDLAAYYAYLPKPPARFPTPGTGAAAPLIVSAGAPVRNIAPCASCHGPMGRSTGAPWIQGMPEVYLRDQLIAFRSGARHNDVNEQMRNVARQMTDEEIQAASKYYASLPQN
ncbi:c-type cytochrome [Chitinasiproducens palmae]|uniref:Cytochrome c553 n=1 Tax=Chitinasiproducens palmae TaxID=1770053 RepID=A0A1H2PVP7_9BURK|nr:c-type cytochrome [Chitinasiproducens palmae]SDV50527.1 Cytochrome c553 [Chitinasiproducens palmae]